MIEQEQPQSAIVTGGASGLGASVVYALNRRNMKVFVLDVAAPSVSAGTQMTYIQGSVTERTDVENAIAAATDGASLRAVVNAAGIGRRTDVVGTEGAEQVLANAEAMVSVNLLGSINVLVLTAREMALNSPQGTDKTRGVIVLISSTAGYDGSSGTLAYAASKAGVAGMVLPAARDLAQVGVRVCGIAPGPFDTPMHGWSRTPAKLKEISRDVLFPRRPGKVEEFSSTVLHLLENSYMNGVVIRLDGGERAR